MPGPSPKPGTGKNTSQEYRPLPSAETDPEKREALKNRDAQARSSLHDAMRLSRDERVRSLIGDPLVERRALGFIAFAEGGVIRYHEGLRYAEHHEVGRDARQALHDTREDLAEDAGEILKRVDEALKALEKQQKEFEKAKGVSPPAFDEAKKRIEKLQKGITDLINDRAELLRFEEENEKQGKSDQEDTKKRREKLLKKALLQLSLPEAEVDGKKQSLLSAIDALLQKLNDEIKLAIRGRFPAQAEYLRDIAGFEILSFIGGAFQEDDSFDVQGLHQRLLSMGKSCAKEPLSEAVGIGVQKPFPLEAEQLTRFKERLKEVHGMELEDSDIRQLGRTLLTGGRDALMANALIQGKKFEEALAEKSVDVDQFIEDLRELWDPSRLVAFLKELGLVENPVGVSLPLLWKRSQLPEGTVDALREAKLIDVPVGTIVQLAKKKIEALALKGDMPENEQARQTLTDTILQLALTPVKREDGSMGYRVGEATLVELARTIALLRMREGDQGEAFKQSKEDVAQLPKLQKKSADRVILLMEDDRKEIQNQIAALFKNGLGSWIQVTLPKVKVDEYGFLERTHLTFREAVTTAKAGGALWWAYIREIPHNFAWTDFERETLLPLLNRRRALTGYKETLRSLSEALDGSKEAVADAQGKVRAAVLEDAAKNKPPPPALSEGERLRQAQEFLGDFAHVHHILKPHWAGKAAFVQDVALWLGVRVGIKEATAYLNATDKDGALKSLNEAQQKDLNAYLLRLKHLAEDEGKNILLPLFHRYGIEVDHSALQILGEPREGGKPSLLAEVPLDVWLTETEREKARPALEAILKDTKYSGDKEKHKNGAVAALIEAFCNPGAGPQPYHDGDKEKGTITPDEAFREVAAIHRDLEWKSRQPAAIREQMKDPERFQNPLDRGVRAGLEMLQDMWAGDWVDKGKVIAIVLAGLWVLRDQWNKGGWGKNAIVGIPLIMAANEMYKRKTGRDFLGEKLFYLSREERQTALEDFRREGAKIERFAVLQTEAGQAALRELLDEKDPIYISDLIAWRNQVGATGKKFYHQGAPKNLSVSRIRQRLGRGATEEEAYKLAYIVFESQCAKAAFDHSLGGDLETQIAMGAALLEKRYVVDAPAGVRVTMLDVIVSESSTPQLDAAIARGKETPVEWLLEHGAALGKRALTEAERGYILSKGFTKDQLAKLPELYEAGKQKALDTGRSLYEWLRPTGEKLKVNITDEALAAYDFVVGTAKAAGLLIIPKVPGVIEWTLDTGAGAATFTKEAAVNLWRELLKLQFVGATIESFMNFAKKIHPDLDFDQHVLTPEYLRDELADYEKFKEELIRQVSVIAATAPTAIQIDKWMKGLGLEVEEQKMKQQDPHKRMLYYEFLKRRIFSLLAAQRVWDIRHNGKEGKNYVGTKTRPTQIEMHWPQDADFKVPGELGKLYEHIFANYDHRTILLLVGKEHGFFGKLEKLAQDYPELWRGTFSDWFYGWITDAVTRSHAGEWMPLAVDGYYGPLLKEAEEKFSDDPQLFAQYKAYLDTVFVNVMLETMLSGKGQRADLTLHVEQAKDLLRQLSIRRGSAADPGQLKNVPLLHVFKPIPTSQRSTLDATVAKYAVGPSPELPTTLKDVLNDRELRWLLEGLQPIIQEPTAMDALQSAVVSLTQTQKENLLKDLSMDPNTMQKKINALQSDMTDAEKQAMRKQFDDHYTNRKSELVSAKLAVDFSLRDEAVKLLAGMSDPKPLEKEMVQYYKDPNISPEQLNQLALFSPRNEQLQRFLNKVAVLQLEHISKDSLWDASVSDLMDPSTQIAKDFQVKRAQWVPKLEALYRMTNLLKDVRSDLTSRTTNTVSLALEEVLFPGKDRPGFAEYEKYLKAPTRKFAVPPEPGLVESVLRGDDSARRRMSDTNRRHLEGRELRYRVKDLKSQLGL